MTTGCRGDRLEDHLHDQRGRVGQRPHPPGCQGKGHFPSENAALKCVCLAVMPLDLTGAGRKPWATRWKRALQAFGIAFDGRLANNHI